MSKVQKAIDKAKAKSDAHIKRGNKKGTNGYRNPETGKTTVKRGKIF
jgi:hypothetical protein